MDFNLRIFRKQKGLTQKQIASFLGVGQSFVSQIESGKDKMPDEYVPILIDKFGDIDDSAVKTLDNSQPSIDSGKVIPYYDAEVAAGTQYGMEMTPAAPAGWIEIGGILKDSEFAMRVYGNSMVPNYPAGCFIDKGNDSDLRNRSYDNIGIVYYCFVLKNAGAICVNYRRAYINEQCYLIPISA